MFYYLNDSQMNKTKYFFNVKFYRTDCQIGLMHQFSWPSYLNSLLTPQNGDSLCLCFIGFKL
jgi:hypothetical protein